MIGLLLRLRRLPGLLSVLWTALRDPRTPLRAKAVAVLAAAYAIWPIDFLPDVVPFAGWLDDLVVVPLLLGLAAKMVPGPVMDQVIAHRGGRPVVGRPAEAAEPPRSPLWPWAMAGLALLVLLGWAALGR
ncbi:DUF1232 domain-containing protein [Sabulicella rubraurantiaca]|uniref:DUF1232 domain-containing protein n=1 Tax=Sabulicella rubraurantiaca TaxID=2811429 RepID=UPI001A96750D|nr:DUF1232 domain-containing protein [Sabulicella rubraurantiaca]